MDSVEAIQRDFLTGMELITNAFNRALSYVSIPLWPVAMQVRAELVDDVAVAGPVRRA